MKLELALVAKKDSVRGANGANLGLAVNALQSVERRNDGPKWLREVTIVDGRYVRGKDVPKGELSALQSFGAGALWSGCAEGGRRSAYGCTSGQIVAKVR